MRRLLLEISKDEYRNNIQRSKAEIEDFIISKMPKEILYGYGYYGGKLKEIDNKFYIEAICGDTAD